jgi:putative alpha-1,2-mannosidase
VESATLQLESGKTFKVEARNQGDKNVYVQKAELNGQPLHRLYITYAEIMSGGQLVFYMGAKPNKQFGK